MIWVFVAVAAVIVVAVAAYTVGTVTARLEATEAVAVYDLAAAGEYVHRRLPDEVAERLGLDAVELLLAWHLDHLRHRGVAAFGSADALAAGRTRMPDTAEADEAVDDLLGRAADAGVPLDPLDAVVVLELNAGYLATIGAVGEQVNGA